MNLENALDGLSEGEERSFYCFCCNQTTIQKYLNKEKEYHVFNCEKCKSKRCYAKCYSG